MIESIRMVSSSFNCFIITDILSFIPAILLVTVNFFEELFKVLASSFLQENSKNKNRDSKMAMCFFIVYILLVLYDVQLFFKLIASITLLKK
jgi:hypothetical protein